MRYRKEGADGDYVFGAATTFLVDSPAAVAQAVLTRLRLYTGEWFLDAREGLSLPLVLGYGTQTTRDREIQRRIAGTTGVRRIVAYSSSVEARGLRVECRLETVYGATDFSEVIR
jgi:hypothetical protein